MDGTSGHADEEKKGLIDACTITVGRLSLHMPALQRGIALSTRKWIEMESKGVAIRKLSHILYLTCVGVCAPKRDALANP